MSKTVTLAFTGVACLSPAYKGVQEVDGPIRAILPCSPRARFGSNQKTQVDAHFVFAAFQHVQLVQDQDKKRQADHKKFNSHGREIGLCLLYNEQLSLGIAPRNAKIRYNLDGPSTGVPRPGYTHVDWIPRWAKFADKRDAKFKDLDAGKIDFVSLEFPAGDVAAGFACALTPKVEFKNGTESARFYAQEITVTLTYEDPEPKFILVSKPVVHALQSARPTKSKISPLDAMPAPANLEFTWGTSDDIRITIGNGSLTSIESVVEDNCGHEHRGKIDFEFEIIYDAISVNDPQDMKPVPEVKNSEIRQIPCIATMI